MATRTAVIKEAPKNPNGQAMTKEESEALKLRLERAFKVFARRFRGYNDPKDRQDFVARVIEFADEPAPHTDNFGVTKMASLVKIELVEPGLEGIRFQQFITDNPQRNTIANTDSHLNHLVRAATGRAIPVKGTFLWDTEEVVGQLIVAVIQRGGDRNDGQRGGLWSEWKDSKKYVAPVEDDEEEETAAPAPAPARRTRKAASAPAPEVVDPELDEVPF